LTREIKGVGGEVKGREGRIGAPRAHDVEGKFGVGKKLVP
jgi:hypothetical protein